MAVAMIGPKFYAWDRNGKPLAFGKLYTYQARTNVPKATYQSEDQVVENTNPVILNGEGYANVYLSGSYKMVLKDDKDNEIWSSDPVSSAQPSEWVNCLSATYLSSSSFKVNGNFTTQYEPGRRVRIDNNASEYAYSTVASSVFAAGETTITVTDPVVTTGLVEVCSSIVGNESVSGSTKIRKDVASMVSDSSLKSGDTVKTIYNNTNTKLGGAFYQIVDLADYAGTPDDYGDHLLNSGNKVAVLMPVNDKVLVEQFGVIGGVDNKDAIVSCLNHSSSKKVFIGEYSSSDISVSISGKEIYGPGGIINNGTGADCFTVTGDKNLISGLKVESVLNQLQQSRVLYIIGNDNVIEHCKCGWQTFQNITSEGQQYGSQGITLSGNNNEARSNETYNTNTGFSDGGYYNRIVKNKVTKSCTGISVGNRSRHGLVFGNIIDCQKGGEGYQGCDGIWGNRNHRHTTIEANTILNAGEHGTYLQGDSFRVIGNFVSGCHGDGIKVGAKTDGNYWYPGETVRELAPNGDYTGFDIVIEGNTCEGNRTAGGTGAEIYIQPNTMDVIISNNTCRFGGAYGIRTVFFSGGTADEVMKGISVLGNKVHDCVEASISITASSDIIIADNEVDGAISTSSRASGEPTERSKISGNICKSITVGRQEMCVVEDNYAEWIFVNNNFARLYGNEFTNQEDGNLNGRVADMRNNVFTCNGENSISVQGCDRTEGNTFLFPDYLGTYPLEVNFDSSTPNNGLFNDNVIVAQQSDRPLRIGGSDGSISGNAISSNGTDTFTVGCYSKNCIISGNVVTAGSFRMEAQSADNIISANAAKISDAGTGNVLGTNRV